MVKIITKLLFVLRILAFVALGIGVIGGTLIFLEIIEDDTAVVSAVFGTVEITSILIVILSTVEGLLKYGSNSNCMVNGHRIVSAILFWVLPFACVIYLSDVRALFYAFALSSLAGPAFSSSFSEAQEIEFIIDEFN